MNLLYKYRFYYNNIYLIYQNKTYFHVKIMNNLSFNSFKNLCLISKLAYL